jgi:hypothetical protein
MSQLIPQTAQEQKKQGSYCASEGLHIIFQMSFSSSQGAVSEEPLPHPTINMITNETAMDRMRSHFSYWQTFLFTLNVLL